MYYDVELNAIRFFLENYKLVYPSNGLEMWQHILNLPGKVKNYTIADIEIM